jgi:hypothetical protein
VEKIILTKMGRFGQFAHPNQYQSLEIRNKALSLFSPHQGGILRGMLSSEKKAGFILTAIAASEGTWVYFSLAGGQQRFWRYMGFSNPWGAGAFGWAPALLCTAFLFGARCGCPRYGSTHTPLMAEGAGIGCSCLSRIVRRSHFPQVAYGSAHETRLAAASANWASALLFGLAHAIWGFFQGSLVTALRTMLATSIPGLMLALVYVASHRILAPCIVAHFVTNLLIEPGLVLAAVRGEMSGKAFAAAA